MMYTSLGETVLRNVVMSNFLRLWWAIVVVLAIVYYATEGRC